MKGAAVSTCHVHLRPDFGADSRGFRVGYMASSLFDSIPTLSAAVMRHCVNRKSCCVNITRDKLLCLVAGCHRWPGHTRELIQRTRTVNATHPLRGSGTFWGRLRPSLRPDNPCGRGAAEGGTYKLRRMPHLYGCTPSLADLLV